MFSKTAIMKSTDACYDKISRLNQELNTADAVVVGAGAGLSTSAGFTYTGERFQKYFGDFIAKYSFRDMYSGGFYPFDSLEEHWAYWSRYIYINRYMDAPKPVYNRLYELVKNRDYFVLTTNVDHQFQKAGFDKHRLFYTQGDYGLWQCSVPCHNETYDNEAAVRKMVEAQGFAFAVIGGLIAPIFAPLGFGQWQPVAASLSGFTAKEAIVSTMGTLANVAGDVEDSVNVAQGIQAWFPTSLVAFSFLVFNLLDSPCLAAIATMAQQLQSRKWFWFAILFQNVFAYIVSLCIYQIGTFFMGGTFTILTAVGFIFLLIILFLLFRPDPYKNKQVYSRRSVQEY